MESKKELTVLMLTSVFPRYEGDATPPFVLNQARAIAELGHRVVVLAPHGKGAEFGEVMDGVEIQRFAYFWPFRLQKLCYEGGMLVNFRVRPWTKLLLPFFFLAQLVETLLLVLQLKPDVLHSHSLVPQGFVCGIVAAITRVPHLTTSHGNDVFGLKKTGLMGFLKRFVLSRAQLVTANSSATFSALEELGCPSGKIRLVPATPNNVCRPSRVVVAKEATWPTLCFVGRLIDEKGVEELIRALPIVREKFPRFHLNIVGDGQMKSKFVSLAEQLDVSEFVSWLGWLEDHQVGTWMSEAHLVVTPSRSIDSGWKEAQGLVVVEAMLSGTPVVASRVGGIVDMVVDGECGFLCEPNSSIELGQCICRALEDRSKLDAMAVNAMGFAKARFSLEVVIEKMLSVYVEVENLDAST